MIIPEKNQFATPQAFQKLCNLLQAGVKSVIYPRYFWDHVSIQTTEIYARADFQKQKTPKP